MNREQWLNIKQNHTYSKINWPTYLVLIIDLTLIYASWQLSFMSIGYKILSCLLLVIALTHFYLLLHEATHDAISKNIFINNFVGHLCGLIIALPFLSRQTSHILHHIWVGHPERDPANARLIKRFSVITRKQEKIIEFIWAHWIPALILNDRIGLWTSAFAKNKMSVQFQRQKLEKYATLTYLGIYGIILYILYSQSLLTHFIVWYLSGFFLTLFIEEIANLPHHAETPLLDYHDKALPYWSQHKVTHACKSVPFWSKYILLNFNLHITHHAYPNEPWHNLENINNKMLDLNLDYMSQNNTLNEINWSLKNRKKPLLKIMGVYFDKIP